MTEETRSTIRPFSCGSEFADWEDANCACCAHSGQDSMDDGFEYEWGACAMEDALTEGCVGDGKVDELLAIEHGWDNEPGWWAAPKRCKRWEEL